MDNSERPTRPVSVDPKAAYRQAQLRNVLARARAADLRVAAMLLREVRGAA